MKEREDWVPKIIAWLCLVTIMGGIGFAIYSTPASHSDADIYARREEHNRQIERALPGCTLKTFEDYRGISHLVVVRCDGKQTTSSSYEWWMGKYSASGATIVIGGEQ